MKARLLTLIIPLSIGSAASAQEIDKKFERKDFDIPRYYEQPFLKDSVYRQFGPSMDSIVNLLKKDDFIGGMKPGTLLDTREVTDGIVLEDKKYFIRNVKPQIESKPAKDGSYLYWAK